MNLSEISLRNLPPLFKRFAAWTLVILGVGYAHGLVFIYNTTGLTHKGMIERYRGNQPEMSVSGDTTNQATSQAGGGDVGSGSGSNNMEDMQFEKSLPEMLTIIHNHIIGMGEMFFISGFIFLFCSIAPKGWKRFLLIEPMAAILTTFGSMWLMWRVHPAFSWLLMLSSGSMAVVFYITIIYSLIELRMKPIDLTVKDGKDKNNE